MDGVRTANRLSASFRETEKSHFALANQVSHGANRFFNRRVWIDPMLVIKINYINTEPAQTSLAGFTHIIRFSAYSAKLRPLRVAHDSKLCRNDNLFAMSSQCA